MCEDKPEALLWCKFKENTHSIHSQQTGFICIYDDQIVILFMELNVHVRGLGGVVVIVLAFNL